MSDFDKYLVPLTPKSEYKWYIQDDVSALADEIAVKAGLYELIEDHTEQAEVVTQIAKIIQEHSLDPARGSRLRPGASDDPVMHEKVRGYIDAYRRRYVLHQDAKKRAAAPITAAHIAAGPTIQATSPGPWHMHRYRNLRTRSSFSRKLNCDVDVSQQRCACGAERQVVRRDWLFGKRTIRIRQVPRGTYT